MTGACYIDNIDIFAQYGVIIEGDGYNELLTFPAIKEPDKNDWAEENGIEVDLSKIALSPLELSITFARITGYAWHNFVASLAVPGYRTLHIPDLELTIDLRLSEMPNLQMYADGSTLTLKFVRDSVDAPIFTNQQNGTAILESDVSIDGIALDKFGIILEDGLNDLVKMPRMKKALTRSFALQNGQQYDTNFIKYDAKDVTFKCYLNTVRMVDFWNLYNALFGMLTQPGHRQITYLGQTFEAYYKRSSNFNLLSHSGEVNCRFDLTLCITKEI